MTDTRKFQSAFKQIKDKVASDLEHDIITEDEVESRTEAYLAQAEKQLKGITDFYHAQSKNGDPEPAPKVEVAPSAPSSKPQGEVPSLVSDWIKNMLLENKSLREDQLLDIYWTTMNSGMVDDYEGEQKIHEALFLCLSSVAGILRTPCFSLTFTPISVGTAFSYPGQVTKGTMKVPGTRWSNAAFGYAVEDGEKMWAEITGWDKDAAESIETMEAFSVYTGDFTGKKQNNKFLLSLNGPVDFEKVGETEISKEWEDTLELFNRTRPEIEDITAITVDAVQPTDDQIKRAKKQGKKPKGGQEFIVRARVARIFDFVAGDNDRIGTSLMTADPTKMTTTQTWNCTFWRESASDFHSLVTPNSTILLNVFAREGEGDYKGTINLNVKWWLPITIAKKVVTKAPQPQPYTGA